MVTTNKSLDTTSLHSQSSSSNKVMPTRQLQVAVTKNLFDELIDSHAQAYLATYPELKEFSNYERSGTINYYIGMVWTNDFERPDTLQLRIRGSQASAKNKMLELDLSRVNSQQIFLPGQIVAFSAEPHLNRQLTVRKFLDPMRISPQMKKIFTHDKIVLMIGCGPYLKADPEPWALFDKMIESIRAEKATHVILIGPFVDMDNQHIREQYDQNWRTVFDRLVEGLHDCPCEVFLVPSGRDIISSDLASVYFYPRPGLDMNLKLRPSAKLAFKLQSVPDPSQIELDGIFVDVTSLETLFHMNMCTSFVNKGPGNVFTSFFRHLISHGIYPIYPGHIDSAIDYPKLEPHLRLDRLGAHILVLPTRFSSGVACVDNRLVATVHKCTLKKQLLLIEIPKIESTDEKPIDSVVVAGQFSHRMVDLMSSSSGSAVPSSSDQVVPSLNPGDGNEPVCHEQGLTLEEQVPASE